MSKAQMLRALWLPGINVVAGRLNEGLASWIEEGSYSISTSATKNKFSVDIVAPLPLTMALAFDLGRMATASFETIASINQLEVLPRSLGWFVIQTYYGAFFASHAIARIFGTSCSQLRTTEISVLRKKGNSLTGWNLIGSGNYTCSYNPADRTLDCSLNSAGGGTHVAFWIAFAEVLNRLSAGVLSIPSELSLDKQEVSAKLVELRDLVGQGWLSELRNDVNYAHLLGCWFPYKGGRKTDASLFGYVSRWKRDPMSIAPAAETTELGRFLATCLCLIALCRALTEDITQRCRQKSFLDFQSGQLLKLLE